MFKVIIWEKTYIFWIINVNVDYKAKSNQLLGFLFLFPHQYVTLRTRYSELMTLTSQYIKFITETQRRLEDEEVRDICLRVPNKLDSNTNLTKTNKHTNKHVPIKSHTCMHTHTFFSACLMTHMTLNVRVTTTSFTRVVHENAGMP